MVTNGLHYYLRHKTTQVQNSVFDKLRKNPTQFSHDALGSLELDLTAHHVPQGTLSRLRDVARGCSFAYFFCIFGLSYLILNLMHL